MVLLSSVNLILKCLNINIERLAKWELCCRFDLEISKLAASIKTQNNLKTWMNEI